MVRWRHFVASEAAVEIVAAGRGVAETVVTVVMWMGVAVMGLL